MQAVLISALLVAVAAAQAQKRFSDHFRECHMYSPKFDACVMNGLNEVRDYFPRGLPEYGVLPFDPFFAKEVVQKRGGPNFNYKLRLKNVYERGWTQSRVTKFRSDLDNYKIVYTQFFPEKSLDGQYELEGHMMGYPSHNKGIWNMTLYNYTQTTTITRRPTVVDGKLTFAGPLKVQVVVNEIGDMNIHVSNLLRGRQVMENILDRIINGAWRAGFPMLRPLINDLVSTAFTEIFSTAFKSFPFNQILPQ